jgi:sulfur-carrier protein
VAAFADKMRSVAIVAFTPNLRRHVDCPTVEVEGATVREVLDRVFADQPRLRGYVVDERGVLRKHMIVFIDGQQIVDRERMTDAVSPRSELYVMQALSGG